MRHGYFFQRRVLMGYLDSILLLLFKLEEMMESVLILTSLSNPAPAKLVMIGKIIKSRNIWVINDWMDSVLTGCKPWQEVSGENSGGRQYGSKKQKQTNKQTTLILRCVCVCAHTQEHSRTRVGGVCVRACACTRVIHFERGEWRRESRTQNEMA